MPLLRYWRVFEIGGLTPAGEQARQELAAALAALDSRAARFVSRRAEARAAAGASGRG
jgi:acyl-[acyl-carrier protein] desaturase